MDNYHPWSSRWRRSASSSRRATAAADPDAKRKTCGKKGKYWYWLQEFRPRAGGCYIVGKFGTYKHGGSEAKVEVDWKPLTDAERERFAPSSTPRPSARQVKEEAAELAALSAGDLWHRAGARGALALPRAQGRAARGLPLPARRLDRDPAAAIRRAERARACVACSGSTPARAFDERTGEELPTGSRRSRRTSARPAARCAWATSTMDRLCWCARATRRACRSAWPPIARCRCTCAWTRTTWATSCRCCASCIRTRFLLICADDDWKTADHHGRTPAAARKAAAKADERCDIVWPVFDRHAPGEGHRLQRPAPARGAGGRPSSSIP
jgi:putative DNA primase/helicase